MFTNDPCNPLDRIRLLVGDTSEVNEYLADQWYVYFLQKNQDNETLASIEAAKAILSRFTSHTREKVDQVELWGNDKFNNYLIWLKDYIENPSISGLQSPVPYAGGISESDMQANRNNTDNVTSRIYNGYTFEERSQYLKDYWIIV